MVKHAKSDILKARIKRKKKDNLMADALALYHSKPVNHATGKLISM